MGARSKQIDVHQTWRLVRTVCTLHVISTAENPCHVILTLKSSSFGASLVHCVGLTNAMLYDNVLWWLQSSTFIHTGSTDLIDINVIIAVMTSSVGAVFVCISVIIISCGCHRYFSWRMKRLRRPQLTCRTTIYIRQPFSRPPNHQTPGYENVSPKSQEQKFKLRPNAAYHPHVINKV